MKRRFTEEELKIIATDGLAFTGQWLMSGKGNLKEISLQRRLGSELANELEPIRLVIRLRFLLAQSQELCGLFSKIEQQASSHRVMNRISTVGYIRGRLDVPTYINNRHKRQRPKEYPSIVVDREIDTPENILLCLTIIEITRDLTRTNNAIIKIWRNPKPVEVNSAEKQVKLINNLLSSSVWTKPKREAKRILYKHGFFPSSLLLRAQKRLSKRRMRYPELYRNFLSWISNYTDSWAPGLVDEDSLASLLSYDSTAWHDRLFELYGTWKLAQIMSLKMGTDTLSQQTNLLGKHKQGPVFSFQFVQQNQSQLNIRLYFQKAGGILWDKDNPTQIYYSTWESGETTVEVKDLPIDEEPIEEENTAYKNRVRGIPDAIFECEFRGRTIYIIVDYKNKFHMSQEHLIMTGYFHNFKNKMTYPYGFLIFRTRSPQPTLRLEITPGKLGVCFVGPSDTEAISTEPFNAVIEMVKEACLQELGAVLP